MLYYLEGVMNRQRPNRRGVVGVLGEQREYGVCGIGKAILLKHEMKVPSISSSARLPHFLRGGVLGLVALIGLGGPGHADCIQDVYPGTLDTFNIPSALFPNWVRAPAAGFMIEDCDDTICTTCLTSNISGVTIYNYGTATGGATGDITGLFFNYACGAQTSAIYTLTYVGMWNVGAGNYPVWTWAGSIALSTDPCDTKNGCYCYPSIHVYTDIAPCPTDGASVILGPGFNNGVGGISDSCGCRGPTIATRADEVDIVYIMKKCNPDVVPPGDTIDYTIYYGLPGGPTVTGLTVLDTQPPYTHWNGIANPIPDPGWDPNPGPPLKLRWTFPVLTTTGGPTGALTFRACRMIGGSHDAQAVLRDVMRIETVGLSSPRMSASTSS